MKFLQKRLSDQKTTLICKNGPEMGGHEPETDHSFGGIDMATLSNDQPEAVTAVLAGIDFYDMEASLDQNIKNFQEKRGIDIDGKIGPQTRGEMQAAVQEYFQSQDSQLAKDRSHAEMAALQAELAAEGDPVSLGHIAGRLKDINKELRKTPGLMGLSNKIIASPKSVADLFDSDGLQEQIVEITEEAGEALARIERKKTKLQALEPLNQGQEAELAGLNLMEQELRAYMGQLDIYSGDVELAGETEFKVESGRVTANLSAALSQGISLPESEVDMFRKYSELLEGASVDSLGEREYDRQLRAVQRINKEFKRMITADGRGREYKIQAAYDRAYGRAQRALNRLEA